MPPTNILEQAQQGNLDALSLLINRSLQKQGITATLDSSNGHLDVMLDSPKVPSEESAAFIHQGLLKLNIETIYQATVYGRKSGEHFATWSKTFLYKSEPTGHLTNRQQKVVQSTSRYQQENRRPTLTLSTGDGTSKVLDLAQLMGFVGVAILLVGIFSPMVSLPIVGTLSYYRDGNIEAIVLIGLAISAAICLSKNRYEWLYGPGLGALILVGLTFFYYQDKISTLKANLERELAGNPFRGIADVAMASMQLQWGWLLLFLGAVLILSSAQLSQRNLTKQSFIAMAVTLAGIIVLSTIQSTSSYIEAKGSATKAKQSEARSYIGSINRTQQAFFLEKNQFAENIDDLGLGIKTDTTNYSYSITVSEKDITVATATPKVDGLKSYTGAVSLAQNPGEEITTVARLCESNSATKTPPSNPTLHNNELECPSGSSEPSANSN